MDAVSGVMNVDVSHGSAVTALCSLSSRGRCKRPADGTMKLRCAAHDIDHEEAEVFDFDTEMACRALACPPNCVRYYRALM